MRDDRERLLDILEAIEAIEKYAAGDLAAHEAGELVQVWIIHHLQVIGEAGRALSEEFRVKHADIDWSGIIGARNVLVHQYFGIDWDVIWRVVKVDLPVLKQRLKVIVSDWPPASPG